MKSKLFEKNILIVEDDIDWINTIKGYLEKENYKNIDCAYNYTDAIEKLKSKTYCIAIIDLNLEDSLIAKMEEYEGFKIIAEIENIQYEYRPRVLVITGYVENIPKNLQGKKNIPGFFFKNNFDKKNFLDIIKGIVPSKI